MKTGQTYRTLLRINSDSISYKNFADKKMEKTLPSPFQYLPHLYRDGLVKLNTHDLHQRPESTTTLVRTPATL